MNLDAVVPCAQARYGVGAVRRRARSIAAAAAVVGLGPHLGVLDRRTRLGLHDTGYGSAVVRREVDVSGFDAGGDGHPVGVVPIRPVVVELLGKPQLRCGPGADSIVSRGQTLDRIRAVGCHVSAGDVLAGVVFAGMDEHVAGRRGPVGLSDAA